MAVDVPALRDAREVGLRARLWRTPLALAALVGAGAGASFVVSLGRSTPGYFPDEYLYSELARSIAHGEGIRVLGEHASFPALLEPLVASVAWLQGDAGLAFRLTQGIHAVAMSLASIPVYLLARTLRLRPALAAAAAVTAVLSPDLVYVGYATADALGYTIALCAVAAGVQALRRPTARWQLGFLAAGALATFARLQYAILLPAFVVASVLVERGAIRRAASRFRIVNGALLALLVVALALGSRALGRYEAVAGFHVTARTLVWVPSSAFLLAVAAGVAVVPGAVAWLVHSVWRPSSREQSALAAFAVAVIAGLLAAAAVMAVATSSERFFERYLMIAIPLVAVAFGCWLEEGRPGRRIAVAIGLLLLVAAARVPVAEFSAGQGAADSPFLLAVTRVQQALGVGDASLLVALLASAAALVAIWSSVGGGRAAGGLALVTTLTLLGATSVGAHLEDIRLSRVVAARDVGTPPTWIDASGSRDVLLLQTAGSESYRAMMQAFWNVAVTRGALLGDGAVPIDGASRRVLVRPDGTLTLNGRTVVRPLLVATSGTRPSFTSGRVIATAPGFELVQPSGPARLSGLVEGLRGDGWLAPRAVIHVWPGGRRRCLSLGLVGRLPSGMVSIRMRAPGTDQTVRLASTSRRELHLPIPAGPMWTATLTADRATSLPAGGLGSARAYIRLATPVAQGSASACP